MNPRFAQAETRRNIIDQIQGHLHRLLPRMTIKLTSMRVAGAGLDMLSLQIDGPDSGLGATAEVNFETLPSTPDGYKAVAEQLTARIRPIIDKKVGIARQNPEDGFTHQTFTPNGWVETSTIGPAKLAEYKAWAGRTPAEVEAAIQVDAAMEKTRLDAEALAREQRKQALIHDIVRNPLVEPMFMAAPEPFLEAIMMDEAGEMVGTEHMFVPTFVGCEELSYGAEALISAGSAAVSGMKFTHTLKSLGAVSEEAAKILEQYSVAMDRARRTIEAAERVEARKAAAAAEELAALDVLIENTPVDNGSANWGQF